MPKEIPYSVLMEDRRAYEILLLRDRDAETFAAIARRLGMNAARVSAIYYRQKARQNRLYVEHIAAALGDKSSAPVHKIFRDAYDCYQEPGYACAYLEQQYPEILAAYRAGEPGTSPDIIKSLPPFRAKLSKKTIARVVQLREEQKASFVAIGKKLRITPAKARQVYEWFYYEQVLAFIKAQQEKAGTHEEKRMVWAQYISRYRSAKECFDNLPKE